MNCTQCSSEIADNCKFCPECGCPQNVIIQCSQCSIDLEPNVKYCPNCGLSTKKARQNTFLISAADRQESQEAVSSIKGIDNTIELNFLFVEDFERAYYSAFTLLTKAASEQSGDIHSTIEHHIEGCTKRILQSSIKDRITTSLLGLKYILPKADIAKCTELLHNKTDDLFAGWASHYSRLEVAGINFLQEVKRQNLGTLVNKMKKGLDAEPNPGGKIAMATSLFNEFSEMQDEAEKEKKHILKYEQARKDALGFIDELWSDIYSYLKLILAEHYHINAPSLAYVKQQRIDFDYALKTAASHLLEPHYELAISCADEALKQFPNAGRFLAIKIEALASLEQWAEVRDCTSNLISLEDVEDDIVLRAQFWAGYAEYMNGDIESAIRLLEKAAVDTNNELSFYPRAHFALAACYGKQKSLSDCMRHVKVAIYFGYADIAMIKQNECFECLLNGELLNEISTFIDNRVENILSARLLTHEETESGSYFLSPLSVPAKRLNKAKKSYVFISEGEQILAIKDHGFLSHGKYGFCFTNAGIYWRERFNAPTMFKYSEIVDLPKGVGLQVNSKSYAGFSDGWHITKILRLICSGPGRPNYVQHTLDFLQVSAPDQIN